MINSKSQFLLTLKLEAIQDITQRVKKTQQYSFKNHERSILKQISKIKNEELKLFDEIFDDVENMIDNIANQFYFDSKQLLYSSLIKEKRKFDNRKPEKFLDKLFAYIEANYLKPTYRLLFLKNNLGLNPAADNFLFGTDISIPIHTIIFIETKTELILKIVNCFEFYELE